MDISIYVKNGWKEIGLLKINEDNIDEMNNSLWGFFLYISDKDQFVLTIIFKFKIIIT